MKPIFYRILTLLLTLGLAACSGLAAQEQTPLSLATVSETESTLTPSATIDWFPATSTATASVTVPPSPTAIPLPGLGSVTFSDDFSSSAAWLRAKAAGDGSNSVIIERNRATIAINTTPATISSLHKELFLSDFYAEVDVSVNRCEATDAYGLLFRAAGDFDSYRYILNCKGETRAERMRGAVVYPLSEWVPSGDVPPGAPGEVTLGVWVSGVEMRFFLNGHYQFSVFDSIFRNGTLGIFASADSPFGMNVSFSKLEIYSVSYVSPTPTATATRTPTPSRTPRP
ncbi:MAG: hypothetical protein CVU44_15710 [Chloroflexi bacterium HGW-Chloroflexi-6]|nr:MAG: hypothetical protein CVU44_15710 [Chloroflexi bacterium HGW-Chloroflexi-6]